MNGPGNGARRRGRSRRGPEHRDPRGRRPRPAVPARAGPDGGRGQHPAAPHRRAAQTAADRARGPRRRRPRAARPPRRGRRRRAGRPPPRAGGGPPVRRPGRAPRGRRPVRAGPAVRRRGRRRHAGGPARGPGGEYALLDRWEEAERRAAHRAGGCTTTSATAGARGENLWMLSRTLWRLCRGRGSRETAPGRSRIRAGQPVPPELAWAYANLSALRMYAGQTEQAIALGEQACRPGRAARPAGGRQLRAEHRSGAPQADDGQERAATRSSRPCGPGPGCGPAGGGRPGLRRPARVQRATRRTGSPRPSASTPRAWPTARSASCGVFTRPACWAGHAETLLCSQGPGTRPRRSPGSAARPAADLRRSTR